jgi:hypothetical protein
LIWGDFRGSRIDRVGSAYFRGLKSVGEIFFEATPLKSGGGILGVVDLIELVQGCVL